MMIHSIPVQERLLLLRPPMRTPVFKKSTMTLFVLTIKSYLTWVTIKGNIQNQEILLWTGKWCIAIHQTYYGCFVTERMSLKPIFAFPKKAIKHPAISASCNSVGISDVNADWFANRCISRLFQLMAQLGKEAENDPSFIANSRNAMFFHKQWWHKLKS